MKVEQRRNILVVRGGAVGDFILTLPVLAALRARFPGGRLEVLGNPVARLAVIGGVADDFRLIGSMACAGLFAEQGTWDQSISDWLGSFDLIVSYVFDPAGVFRRNVAKCSSATFIAGPHRPDDGPALHATEQLLAPLRELGIANADARPRLRFPLSASATRLAVHIGSGSSKKNWPEENWSRLLQRIMAETDFELLVISGEAEEDRAVRLTAGLPAHRIRRAHNLPWDELAGQMKSCRAFIGHDSGITHLAAALDLPGIALWADTVLTVWRPVSSGLTVLHRPEPDAVWNNLQERFFHDSTDH